MQKFKFKKKFGQNFLKNETIIYKIISSIAPSKDDLIIEIGPGAGAITKKLKTYKANLFAYEIDEETKPYLLPLEDNKTKIIYKDFLETDLKKEIEKVDYNNLFFTGNLPYYITTPIIEHIIDSNLDFISLTIMVQKEVAERFLANTHSREYGYMTVLLNFWFDIKKISDVKKEDFIPMPKVESTVLLLTKKKKLKTDYTKFKKILKDSFQFKRKTIKNNLKEYNLEKVETILQKYGLNLQNRAEDISLEIFIDLADNL